MKLRIIAGLASAVRWKVDFPIRVHRRGGDHAATIGDDGTAWAGLRRIVERMVAEIGLGSALEAPGRRWPHR